MSDVERVDNVEKENKMERAPFLWCLLPINVMFIFLLFCPTGKISLIRFVVGGLTIMVAACHWMAGYENISTTKVEYWLAFFGWTLLGLLAIAGGFGFLPDLKWGED